MATAMATATGQYTKQNILPPLILRANLPAEVELKNPKQVRRPCKGQLISKCLFGTFNCPKKQMKIFDFTTMVPQVELFSSFFWEN